MEIPTISDRVVPFVIGGGGVAAATSSSTVYYLVPEVLAQLEAMGISPQPILPGPIHLDNTTTQMALTLGGGASFLVTRHLAADLDLRVLHTLGGNGINIGRFGGGVSYRF
jgi:opacity protein-like surface antigen